MTDSRNLFDPRFGKKPARFVGRDDVLRDIRAALADTEEQYSVSILTGIKGSGKTSILAEIRMAPEIPGLVFAELNRDEEISQAALSAIPGGGVTTVFLLDDVNKGIPGLREFLTDFSSRVHQGEALKLILAGLPHSVDELLKDCELLLLRKSERIALGNVRVDEVVDLFNEVFVDVEDDILLRAAEATAGYPYMIQLIGYHLSKKGGGIDIDNKAVDKAIFLAKIELYKNIQDPLIWSLSSKDRMFLWAMAQDEGSSEFGEIAKRMNVSTGYASKYRERLINAGVIYSSAYGELAFALPFMKEYVEKEFIELFGGEGGKRRL